MALRNTRDDPPRAGGSSPDASPLLRDASEYEMEDMRARETTYEATSPNARGANSNSAENVGEALDSTTPKPDNLLSSPSYPKSVYWTPVSLNFVYLVALAALSILLAICCFALVVASRKHHGIADAGTTGEFNFMKRFLPTLVAVLYTLTWSPVAADVIRTEPWALLSRPVGSKAQDSLLKKDQMWWNHVADAVRSKRRLGGIRWALLISVIASLTASVVINPLSAGLFDTARISTTDDRQFFGTQMSALSAQPLRIGDGTYLRAAVNLLFNVSTSAWNTDEFSVAPFWPATSKNPSFSATLSSSPGIWTATQDVVSARVHCEPFSSAINSTEPYGNTVWTGLPFLQTKDGCAVISPDSCGGGTWAQISNTTSQATYKTCTAQGFNEYFLFCSYNATPTALMHQGYSSKSYFTGQVCSTTYTRARIPVTVANTLSRSTVLVDTDQFQGAQQPMDVDVFDVDSFESEFISQTGATHLRPTSGIGFNLSNADQNSNFEGPSLVLAASQNYSINSLMLAEPAELAKQAGIIKQRFMAEVFLSSFNEAAKRNDTRTMRGSISQEQSRLVVDLGVGIAMGLVFVLLSCAAISLAFIVSPYRRPLHIYTDPSESCTAAFVLKDSTISTCFKNMDQAIMTELESALNTKTFFVEDGKLFQLQSKKSVVSTVTKTSTEEEPMHRNRKTPRSAPAVLDWRPFTLRRKAGFLLGVALACVLATLVSIYAVSTKRPLYQSAFVYSSDINLGRLSVTTLAPYSIIPTLVAVGIKLWWGTIDSAHRRLAPFLAMADTSRAKPSKSPTNSYITTPVLWITVLAVRRRHWLLAIVTVGALVSEILQVSMAALWTRELGVLKYDVGLKGQYEIRSLPQIFEDERPVIRSATNIAHPRIAEHLYGGAQFQTSWMYGSLAELAFGALPPAWSKDGWSFPPIDLSDVSKMIPNLPRSDITTRSLNISMNSQGLRGRIECSIIDNQARWLNELTKLTAMRPYTTKPNTTAPGLRSGFEFSSTVRVVNFTAYNGSQPTIVNIGQWLHFNYSSNETEGDPLYNPSTSNNFTVLWTNSSYPYLYHDDREDAYGDIFEIPPRLVFAEKPEVQALECRPLFETSKARITVNAESGKIYDIKLLEDVHPTAAWSNKFERHYSNEIAYYEPKYQNMDAVEGFNTTVSWGYLFQLALLQACNVQGFVTGIGDRLRSGIPGPTPFSFIETDLYSDPYSYASLALVDYNRQALLQATTLTNVTQHVFSTFFQWFVSSRSGFTDDYWAYQPVGASLPLDLDFGATESIVTIATTGTNTETLCASSMSTYLRSYSDSIETFSVAKCARPTLTSYSTWARTDTYVTISDTRTTLARSKASASTNPASKSNVRSTTTATASKRKRATATDTLSDNIIDAEVSIHTETLVVSSLALFLSISILILLVIFTIIIYLTQSKRLSLLHRDFDCPASLLAAVYASEKLQAWSEQQHKRRPGAGMGDTKWRRSHANASEIEAAAKMGYFGGSDGKEHWGIELAMDHSSLMADLRPEVEEVRLQETANSPHGFNGATAAQSTVVVQQGGTHHCIQ
ncbi:hypothetical protein EKO04_010927 [Ascochyta lentis]|uniref:Uncharacterized protein n=1 Tax=Ascochyta lentis TaxID=205686 RepID=A0A8H7MD04_9PLEO|nr:hypothetical protein EKO04_010927 [Ascochyta lentis]